MLRYAFLPLLLALAPEPVAALSPPEPDDIAKLIQQLSNPDYAIREAATQRLEEIGEPALTALRAAKASEDLEVVRRSSEVLRKVERKLANEKAIAPTMVQLDVRDMPLDEVLAELSKQAGYDVVLGGVKPEEPAARAIALNTGGRVPFWSAILKVCDIADLQVAVSGGFGAPGAMPYLGRPKAGLRVARNTNRAVVLEARDPKVPRRPAAVRGAVLVEVVPFPKGTSAGEGRMAILQAWPEPRIQWQAVSGVKILKAADEKGSQLRGEYLPGQRAEMGTGTGRVTLLRNADGSATAVSGPIISFTPNGLFVPNSYQALLRFSGDALSNTVSELEVVLSATIRTEIKPLSRVELRNNQTAIGEGQVELEAFYRAALDGKPVAEVKLTFDSKNVQPAGLNDDLPGAKGAAGLGNHTIQGVRVTDKNGRPLHLGVRGCAIVLEPDSRTTMNLTLELVPDRNSHEPPATITFWGTYAQVIEVPVRLKGVALSGGR